MVLDCMTYMEMFGNGLQTGMDVRIQTVLHGVIRVLTVSYVVVVGAVAQTVSSRPTGVVTIRRPETVITVFDFANLSTPRFYFTKS